MFSYSEYTGFWPVFLVAISAFSSFFAAMFALTYGRSKQILTLITFLLFGGLYRYGQILLLQDTEGLLLPVVALILTLISILLAWRLMRPSKTVKEKASTEQPETENTSTKKHHHPAGDDEPQHNPPH